MLLGKRPRHTIKRTTSMTEFGLDPSPVEFAVTPPESESDASESNPNHTITALISPRVARRHSADYSLATPFLKSCCLCDRRFIPGRDIYMYRGDSAFCSLECRQKKMSQDERKERLSSIILPKKPPPAKNSA